MHCDIAVIGCVADDASDFPTTFHVHHRVAATILGVVRGSCCVEVKCSCFGCLNMLLMLRSRCQKVRTVAVVDVLVVTIE